MDTAIYTDSAVSRNTDAHLVVDQSLKLEVWSSSTFPAALLIQRRTHRPISTCRVLATVAGYREHNGGAE